MPKPILRARCLSTPAMKLGAILALAAAASCAEPSTDRLGARDAAGAPDAAGGPADAGRAPDAGGAPDQAANPPAGRTCASMEPDFLMAFDTPGRVCVESVPDQATWKSITLAEGKADRIRSTKWFLPRGLPPKIPPSFLDANTWAAAMPMGVGGNVVSRPWHMFFAVLYLDGNPSKPPYIGVDRIAFTGNFSEVVIGNEVIFGYDLHDAATITCEEQKLVHKRMSELVSLRPLARLIVSRDPPVVPELPPDGCQITTVVLGQ